MRQRERDRAAGGCGRAPVERGVAELDRAARRSRRAPPRSRTAPIAPSAVSRGNSLRQASLAAKRAARLAARPGPSPASCSSCAEKILRRSSAGVSRSRRSMRAISTVSMPQRRGAVRQLPCVTAACSRRGGAQQQRGVGAAEAAREHQRDVAARRLRRGGHRQRRRTSGSSSRRVAMPGTTPRAQRRQRQHRLDEPEAASRWPKAHLKPVTGGGSRAEHARISARASDASDCARAVAVRHDHADVGRRAARHRRARARSRAPARRRRRASAAGPAPRWRSRCRAPRRAPWRRAAAAAASRLEHQRRRAFAHQRCRRGAASNGRSASRASSPSWW